MALWILLLLTGLGLAPKAQTASEIFAEVDGVAITVEEVEKPLASQLSKLEEQIYNLKRQRLDALINESCWQRKPRNEILRCRRCLTLR